MKCLKSFFKGLIPRIIANKVVLWFFELLRKIQKLKSAVWEENLKENVLNMQKHLEILDSGSGFIEDQNNYFDLKFGKVNMKHSGCEIIAVFNALHNLLGDHECSLPGLISEFEQDGMVLSGKFGTSPKAIKDYFSKKGFEVKLETKEKHYETLAKDSDSLILTMYNDKKDITKEVHTVNISKAEGMFMAHNVYCNGQVVGPFDSVTALIDSINSGKAKGISLIGIRKKYL